MTNLIAYAQNFVSFLVDKLTEKEIANIKTIILFGSVAREEATKGSDVDIFIDIYKEDAPLAKKIWRTREEFNDSIFWKSYWRLFGIQNEIKPIVGQLEYWKDIKASIIANGITLYGKYSAKASGKNFVLFSWEKIRPESRRVWLSKVLYGYNYAGKNYKGMLDIYSGKKISTNCVLIPIESYRAFLKKFRQAKISVKISHISLL